MIHLLLEVYTRFTTIILKIQTSYPRMFSGVDDASKNYLTKEVKDRLTELVNNWNEEKLYESMFLDNVQKAPNMNDDELKIELKIAEIENAFAFVESTKHESLCSVRITGPSGCPIYAWGNISTATFNQGKGCDECSSFTTYLTNTTTQCTTQEIEKAELRINGIKVATGGNFTNQTKLGNLPRHPWALDVQRDQVNFEIRFKIEAASQNIHWLGSELLVQANIKEVEGGVTEGRMIFEYCQFTVKSDNVKIGDRFYNDISKDALWAKMPVGGCYDDGRVLLYELDKLQDGSKGKTWKAHLSTGLIPNKCLDNNIKRIDSMGTADVQKELLFMRTFQRWIMKRKVGAYIQITKAIERGGGEFVIIAMEKYNEFNADYFTATNAPGASFTVPFKKSLQFVLQEDDLEIRANGLKVGELKGGEVSSQFILCSGKCNHPLVNWEHFILVMRPADDEISSNDEISSSQLSKDGGKKKVIVIGLVFTTNMEDSSAINRFYREYQHSLYSKTKKEYIMKQRKLLDKTKKES